MPMTFAELLVKYQAVIQAQKAPMTQRDQASTLKYWYRVLGYKPLSEITPRDLAEQRDVLLKTKKASMAKSEAPSTKDTVQTRMRPVWPRAPRRKKERIDMLRMPPHHAPLRHALR